MGGINKIKKKPSRIKYLRMNTGHRTSGINNSTSKHIY